MKMAFRKMNGAGNDFIMVDNRTVEISPGPEVIRRLCDRKRGIGADGVILIEDGNDVDFRMRYYNANGGEAEMCGNGARCAAIYAASLGLGRPDGDALHLRFVAAPGPMEARITGRRVALAMTDATDYQESICLQVAEDEEIVHFINTGVPHAVAIESDVGNLDDEAVSSRGRAIRAHSRFSPAGVNASFISLRADGGVDIRTYERGVEAETLACGTGAVAAAIVLHHLGRAESPVTLITHGGETLVVSFTGGPSGARNVILEGPAADNFDGSIDLATWE